MGLDSWGKEWIEVTKQDTGKRQVGVTLWGALIIS